MQTAGRCLTDDRRLQSPPITPLNIRSGYKFKYKHWQYE